MRARPCVGVVDSIGAGVTAFKPGDHVLISCISSCGKCEYCRRGLYSHCTTGGRILGNEIDGTQAEYVRTPHADTSLYRIPDGADEEALVMLSDILPTGFECGVLNGKVAPGSTAAIVGSRKIDPTRLITYRFTLDKILDAYDTFNRAADTGALKVIISA